MSLAKPCRSQTSSERARSYFLTADFFLFFSNPAALRILDIVRKEGMTCLTISKTLGITPRSVLAKLRAMEREGILVSYVKSKDTFYRMANSHIARAFDRILAFPEGKLKKAKGSSISLQPYGQKVDRPA